MKKYLLFLVAAMLATVARAAIGDTFTYQELNFEVTSEDDHTVKVTKNPDATGDISIPSFAVNGSSRYSVAEIGDSAFYYCRSLTSVNIPNSVTTIGEWAFYYCRSLTSVNIPNSVTTIGERAFYSCSSLTSVTIPNSVTKIEKNAFSSCSSLTSVNIPNSVTTIEVGAFSSCSSLTSVSIPNSVTTIGESAFYGCRGLTSVTIPNSVTEIGSSAFANCSLTSVNIPNSVTTIGDLAFNKCSRLSEIVVENGNPNYSSEDGVLFNIDKTELNTCPGGKEGEYSIPNSVTKIITKAFEGCNKLTSIDIPNSVTTIGESAFYFCSSLTSVTIPNSVTTIGERTFTNCNGLTSVTIPNSVTTIGYMAFNGCFSLTSVTIPNSVTTIGQGAFQFCKSLTSVTIPNSVTTIGEWAFYECSSLTSVTIPNSVTEIRGWTFAGCTNLKAIYNLNPAPQIVADNAFDKVSTDVVVYIPKGSLNEYNGWGIFTDFREMGAFDVALSEQTLELIAGNTATVTATVTKDDDMTVESEEWTSSNPEVATVDNGVITAVTPGEAVIWFTAVDGYGVPHTEACKVTVIKKSGVAEIVTDTDAPVDVYNLQGVAVLRNAAATELGNLPAGLYIVRQGKSVKKISVK